MFKLKYFKNGLSHLQFMNILMEKSEILLHNSTN